MAEQGITLAELASVDPGGNGLEASQHALSPCNIHTGFQGHVIQLSMASLRYWSELGLQPLSGPKNIKAVIVTRHQEDEPRARRLAESLRNIYTVSYLSFTPFFADEVVAKSGNGRDRQVFRPGRFQMF